jgi:hypothetical protein
VQPGFKRETANIPPIVVRGDATGSRQALFDNIVVVITLADVWCGCSWTKGGGTKGIACAAPLTLMHFTFLFNRHLPFRLLLSDEVGLKLWLSYVSNVARKNLSLPNWHGREALISYLSHSLRFEPRHSISIFQCKAV